MHRFYIPPAEWDSAALAISGADAHHCHDVMRCQVGDQVIVFDGRGTQSVATIAATGRSRVELEPGPLQQTAPLPAELTLCQAIPKGKNMELVVQKATELGVAHIVPLLTENTVVRLDAREAAKKQLKWQRTAIEACKQSGQNWMPEVAAPVTLAAYLGGAAPTGLDLIASLQPGARHLKQLLVDRPVSSARVLIGPEGDFSEAEVAAATAAGHQPITLGPITLRTETAAIYCLSVLAHELF
ncbi:MAG: 16S rRNA (uracil(1498)-N(3))-methyltransferase [Verrucomicrobiales bacterium]